MHALGGGCGVRSMSMRFVAVVVVPMNDRYICRRVVLARLVGDVAPAVHTIPSPPSDLCQTDQAAGNLHHCQHHWHILGIRKVLISRKFGWKLSGRLHVLLY